MPVHNEEIAAIFEEIADLLEIKGDNPFRVRAYRNAVLTLRGLGPDVQTFLDQDQEPTKLPGIGKDLERKIREILATGTCQALEKLHKELPLSLTQLLKIPGLGPKRVRALYQQLHIETPQQLHQAAADGRLQTLPGFGVKTQQHILETIKSQLDASKRFKLDIVTAYAEPLVAYLKKTPGVQDVVIAGSYRRLLETVGDLDILVTASSESSVMQRFITYEQVQDVAAQGDTRATIRLRCGLQVDLRLISPQSFGAALQYFTGSKAHNIAVRRLARRQGLKINEYGVFKGKRQIAGQTESDVYQALGLSYIEPELREDRGEIEEARAGRLPRLITLADLKGDLHLHTRYSDGYNTIEEMVDAARERHFEYIAVTEHSHRLKITHGLDSRHLRQQCEAIDQLNATLKDITILKGLEVDILEDGRLDLPDDVLSELDLVIGAVHSHFNLSGEKQTQRILRAMDHPYFTILAHPTGRIINKREAYDLDMDRIIGHAFERGCFLELNSHPKRLDLNDIYCQSAKAEGVLVSINSDAHRVVDFNNLRFGVGQARRGRLEKKDVLNTRTLPELRRLLNQTMK
ncbi:MAG: DNA polymerase/3'-5' exonuclease PolX [Desulfobacterales bacterium]|nr:DNA polymerase/3'-5' exonuclease PolX [Desulfobacterales bacterium]